MGRVRELLCKTCGNTAIEDFYQSFDKRRGKKYYEKSRCKKCNTERKRGYASKPFHVVKNQHLVRMYGITLERYFEMLLVEQAGKCPLCTRHYLDDPQWENRMWPVDHCHATGAVRGILCKPCNTALGLVREEVATLKRMMRYVKAGG